MQSCGRFHRKTSACLRNTFGCQERDSNRRSQPRSATCTWNLSLAMTRDLANLQPGEISQQHLQPSDVETCHCAINRTETRPFCILSRRHRFTGPTRMNKRGQSIFYHSSDSFVAFFHQRHIQTSTGTYTFIPKVAFSINPYHHHQLSIISHISLITPLSPSPLS
jgi:hypothetical protein